MKILNIISPKLKEASVKIQNLESKVNKYHEVQELLVDNILTLQGVQKTYTGNDYKTYKDVVNAISDKYNNKADWGCLQTGAVIDLRAAFVLGEGLQVVHNTETRAEAENELRWAEDFFSWNDLDAEGAQELAKEAEIEGKIALKMIYEPGEYREWPGMVSVRFIPWTTKKYKITADPNDYQYYKTISWEPTATAKGGILQENEFVYKKFGGRLSDPNEAQPKIAGCLTQIDRLDKALWDLRGINHLYASPTPDIEVQDKQEVQPLMNMLGAKGNNWKIGKLLIHTGKFQMVSADASGIQSLISEIELCVKMISGVTGIPIHHLGLLDLLKNRATGDNTREVINAATNRERRVWIGAYEELIEKSMKMFNEKANPQKSEEKMLDHTKISINIPLITQEQWDRIERVLIPAAVAGIISKEFVAEQIPGVDLEAEAERRNKKEEVEIERVNREMEKIKAEQQAQPIPPKEETA